MNIINNKVIGRLSADTKELFDFYDRKGLFKTKKQKSEDISGLLENAISDLIEGAVAPKIDAEPDIRIHGEPYEIKTSSGHCWFSGTFSNNPSFFMAGKTLKKDDWCPSKSDSYYATTYDKKTLYENYAKDKVDIFVGRLEAYMRGKQQCIKIHTEGGI